MHNSTPLLDHEIHCWVAYYCKSNLPWSYHSIIVSAKAKRPKIFALLPLLKSVLHRNIEFVIQDHHYM